MKTNLLRTYLYIGQHFLDIQSRIRNGKIYPKSALQVTINILERLWPIYIGISNSIINIFKLFICLITIDIGTQLTPCNTNKFLPSPNVPSIEIRLY